MPINRETIERTGKRNAAPTPGAPGFHAARSPMESMRRVLAASVVLIGLSCIEVRDVGNVEGPQDETDLVVVATTDTPAVFEGTSSAVLTAEASGGTPPYLFRWDQNGGPAVEISNETSARLTVNGLTDPGRYVFRVVATDAGGFHATDYVTVEVLSSVTASVPDFALVGQPAGLSAEVASDLAAPGILWEVTQGTATLDDPASATPKLTTSAGETVRLRLTITPAGATEGGAATREFEVVSVFDLHPRVKVQTNLGDFVIELDGENTPKHMVNFLLYADDGFYSGMLFHRNACTDNPDTGACDPFVLQGGGYHRVDGELVLVPPTRDTVAKENENSPSNGTLYSVALALTGGDPNSGATQFFINLSTDNAFLDAQGFTVFGQVVEGADVVDAIVATPRVESSIISGEVSLPAEDVIIEQVTRATP
jgi:cyclophilin family peptidyl-prolyl cis-trans isomerase